jgi:hypothetical protein
MTLVISKGITLRKGWQPMDADAAAYIAAVETADTEPLEEKTKIAIDNFVLGCKADGIWTAIKASCILAGARTLAGALVPLVGAAPTNVGGLFVSGDYNRKTGLVGDGSTKYLDSNRNNNADPQNNKHLSVYISTNGTLGGRDLLSSGLGGGHSRLTTNTGGFLATINTSGQYVGATPPLKFAGASRTISTEFLVRDNGQSFTRLATSTGPQNSNISVFNRASSSNYSDARLAFYSIGESLDLALLDARVTGLINAFAAAIP